MKSLESKSRNFIKKYLKILFYTYIVIFYFLIVWSSASFFIYGIFSDLSNSVFDNNPIDKILSSRFGYIFFLLPLIFAKYIFISAIFIFSEMVSFTKQYLQTEYQKNLGAETIVISEVEYLSFPKYHIDSILEFNNCIIQKGALKCWGSKSYKNGNLKNEQSLVPQAVIGLKNDVSFVSLGQDYTCAIQKGALKCWGNNKYGQLGNGTKKMSLTPQVVKGMTEGVTSVGLAINYACAIQKGALKCWGNNKYGQLGNGTKKLSLAPQIAKGMTSGVTAVSTPYNFYSSHTCAIQKEVVKCTGDNLFNQLGSNEFRNKYYSTQFVPVDNLKPNVELLKVSNKYSCAIQKGALKCWGNNFSGQLGNRKKQTSRKGIIDYFLKIIREIQTFGISSFHFSD